MATKKKTTKRTPAAKKPTTRKKSTKKAPAKKATTKKVTRKKAAASARTSKTTKKSTAKKAAAKKTTAKKKVTKKVVKKTTKKAATTKKKAATKKPTSKKKIVKKSTQASKKKAAAKKAPAKKTSTKKQVTKKASTKKAPVKKAPAVKPAKPAKPKIPGPESTLEEAMQHEWTEAQLRKVKTGLKKKDLDYFRGLLQEKLIEIVGNIKGMELTRSDALADIAHMPLHMADVGSDNFDQEFTLGLMEFERKILSDIKDALVRMKDRLYGVCLDSGRPISRARLEAKPWAKYCIEAARLHEKRGW